MTDDLQSALGEADFVGVLIPASPSNQHFINAERLGWMQPHAWLINTARGMVVDERALYDALNSRRIAGAALDVFDIEPYEPADASHDLRTLPNVILSPHQAYNTPESLDRMLDGVVTNIENYLTGRPASIVAGPPLLADLDSTHLP